MGLSDTYKRADDSTSRPPQSVPLSEGGARGYRPPAQEAASEGKRRSAYIYLDAKVATD